MITNNFLEASFDEIIFHNRNKNYGAYVLRQEQERNTKIALLSSCAFFCMLLLIPFLKTFFGSNSKQPPFKDLVFEVYDLPSILPKKEEIKLAPPPSAANTQRSVEMVVRRQENMIEENILSQEQLSQSNIGTVTTDNPTGDNLGTELGVPNGTGFEAPEIVSPPSNAIVDFPEILPEFPGGEKALYQFISKHVVYPDRAKQLEQEGKVFLKFVVNEDGKVSNVEVLRKAGFGFDEESVRVISMLPAFKPAMQNGRNVKARYVIPIAFKLN